MMIIMMMIIMMIITIIDIIIIIIIEKVMTIYNMNEDDKKYINTSVNQYLPIDTRADIITDINNSCEKKMDR